MELTCLGLVEKNQQKEVHGKFNYNTLLKKAIDKFSLLNYMCSSLSGIDEDIFPTNETALIKMVSNDIADFVEQIPVSLRDSFKTSEWVNYGPLVNLGKENYYYCTEELLDIVNCVVRFRKTSMAKYKELELASQKFIRELFDKTQDEYCEIRNFLEQKKNAFITANKFLEDDSIRKFKNKYIDIFESAYEKLSYKPSKIKICNHCGLVLKALVDGTLYCVSERCSRKSKGFTKFKEIDIKEEIWVLKENVARYIYYPGILEQEILRIVRGNNIDPTLWPKKDTWDLSFNYNGELWAIDAKDVKNPLYIIKDIELKNSEINEYDKIIYIVPSDKSKMYLEAIRNSIKSNRKFECMTIADFRRLLEKEEE